MERYWRQVRIRAEVRDVVLHDLRHSFASYGAAKNLSLPIIGALLGHLHPSTTQRYAHLAQSPLRDAVEQIGQSIEAAMKTKKAPEGA
jgi:site-specific recombinase XerD